MCRWACGSSGGLDSSTILHYAATGIGGAAEDVFDFVSRAAASTRAATSARWRAATAPIITKLDLNPDVELQGAIEEFAYYSDEPSADAGALPVWFLSKMSRRT